MHKYFNRLVTDGAMLSYLVKKGLLSWRMACGPSIISVGDAVKDPEESRQTPARVSDRKWHEAVRITL